MRNFKILSALLFCLCILCSCKKDKKQPNVDISTGLHDYLNEVRWYVCGGGHINYFSWKDSDVDAVTTFGVAGIIGLEYKFANLPLAVSADWQPAYIISNPSGFSAENGGIGIKYTF